LPVLFLNVVAIDRLKAAGVAPCAGCERKAAGSLVLIAVALFVMINVAAGRVVGMRADLTEDKLYSLSDGTGNLVRKLERQSS
jgi:ABC-type uncharacterized transport system involved in gliding motility auxiliary subunit